MMPEPKKTVVLTGFGPFKGHSINASWVCVKELAKSDLLKNVTLVAEEIPVGYSAVLKRIPELWREHQPDLMVHIGVSGMAEGLELEQLAHNDGYNKLDIEGSCPETNRCVIDCPHATVTSQLDMAAVHKRMVRSHCDVEVSVSNDPGRYLCDFCYCLSLNVSKSRSAFIHVPPLDRRYTLQQLVRALHLAIVTMLELVQPNTASPALESNSV